jgi:2,3-bisphosphoglycerate-dependent phosphoglycerate mutase
MLTVWLIRHGETIGNAAVSLARSEAGSEPQLGGALDNPSSKTISNTASDLTAASLTPRGQDQATQIAAAVPRTPDLIVTSPLWRTKQTAEPTCQRFPSAPQAEWPVQEFSYLAAKRYENAKTLEQRRLLDLEYWQRGDPDYVSGAGAESFASLMTRVKLLQDRWQQLAAEAGNSETLVLVFSHAWFIRAVVWSLISQSTEVSPQQMWRLHHFAGGISVANGSIFKVQARASEIWFTGINTAHLGWMSR